MAYGFIVDRSYQITINTNGGGRPESFIAFFLGSRDLRNTPNPPVEYTFLKVANEGDAERIYINKDEIGPGEGQYTITPRMQRDQTGGVALQPLQRAMTPTRAQTRALHAHRA